MLPHVWYFRPESQKTYHSVTLWTPLVESSREDKVSALCSGFPMPSWYSATVPRGGLASDSDNHAAAVPAVAFGLLPRRHWSFQLRDDGPWVTVCFQLQLPMLSVVFCQRWTVTGGFSTETEDSTFQNIRWRWRTWDASLSARDCLVFVRWPCNVLCVIVPPCMLSVSPPKGGTKRDFAVFASKIQLLSKKVCYKVSLCENSQRQSCIATSFPYLTVHRWIASDVPIYLKFAIKVTHPFRKRRFRQISLNRALAVRSSERSSVIVDRKSAMRFPSSHRWTLCVNSKIPKGWLKRIFTYLCVAFHIFVAGNRRHFKFGMYRLIIASPAYGRQVDYINLAYIKSQYIDDKSPLKGACRRG